MSALLAPYLRYYSSNRPAHDSGVQPKVLNVFDDPLVEARFHSVARAEMARTGGEAAPMGLSHQHIGTRRATRLRMAAIWMCSCLLRLSREARPSHRFSPQLTSAEDLPRKGFTVDSVPESEV